MRLVIQSTNGRKMCMIKEYIKKNIPAICEIHEILFAKKRLIKRDKWFAGLSMQEIMDYDAEMYYGRLQKKGKW